MQITGLTVADITTELARMKPSDRKAAVRQLEAEGWKVWYQRSGTLWRMERQTVVYDAETGIGAERLARVRAEVQP